MTARWTGSISLESGKVVGSIEDAFGWTISLAGSALGANAIALVDCRLVTRGRPATEHDPDSVLQHEVLANAPGAHFSGELRRSAIGLARIWQWRGSLVGPWLMRLTNERWYGSGPIALRGEPVE